VYVSGHTHEWGTYSGENEFNNKLFHLIKVRGYKFNDPYATAHGFGEQQNGCTIGIVIDPSEKIYTFSDIDKGYEFLEFLRSKR